MGLFKSSNDDSSSSSPAVCPPYPTPVNDATPIAGDLTFTQLAKYISGASMGAAVLLSLALIILHATHLNRPAEQIKIIRITAIIPCVALLLFGGIYLSVEAVYLSVEAVYLYPWIDVCESISMINFMLLLYAYLDARRGQLDAEMGGAVPDPKHEDLRMQVGPMNVNRSSLMVVQYLPVTIVVAIATDGTEATGIYCRNSNGIHFAHLWLVIIQSVSVAVAIMSIIRFMKERKGTFGPHGLIGKLLAFKLIIGLKFIQDLIFSFAGNKFTPTDKLSYADVTISMEAMLMCLELVLFAVAFFFVYSHRPYTSGSTGAGYRGGPLGVRALVNALSPIHIIRDTISLFQ